MADPVPLTRQQIARFVGNDPDAIRAIERLFDVVGGEVPSAAQDIEIVAGSAQAIANSASARVAQLDRRSRGQEVLQWLTMQ